MDNDCMLQMQYTLNQILSFFGEFFFLLHNLQLVIGFHIWTKFCKKNLTTWKQNHNIFMAQLLKRIYEVFWGTQNNLLLSILFPSLIGDQFNIEGTKIHLMYVMEKHVKLIIGNGCVNGMN